MKRKEPKTQAEIAFENEQIAKLKTDIASMTQRVPPPFSMMRVFSL